MACISYITGGNSIKFLDRHHNCLPKPSFVANLSLCNFNKAPVFHLEPLNSNSLNLCSAQNSPRYSCSRPFSTTVFNSISSENGISGEKVLFLLTNIYYVLGVEKMDLRKKVNSGFFSGLIKYEYKSLKYFQMPSNSRQ